MIPFVIDDPKMATSVRLIHFKNSPTTIQGRAYSAHALDQMQNRGFTPSVIEQTIGKSSYSTGKNPGTMVFMIVLMK